MIYLQLFLVICKSEHSVLAGDMPPCHLYRHRLSINITGSQSDNLPILVTIAEMTPGPIAINSATFVGTQVGGILGALCATVGCILPLLHYRHPFGKNLYKVPQCNRYAKYFKHTSSCRCFYDCCSGNCNFNLRLFPNRNGF